MIDAAAATGGSEVHTSTTPFHTSTTPFLVSLIPVAGMI
jgi:hypothetical protein